MKTAFLALFCTFLLVPFVFASIGTGGNYNSETRFSFIGYNSTSTGGYQARGSDQITGSFSIGTTYTGRLGILKYCSNSIVDSGEDCDGTNLNSESCISRGFSSGTLACLSNCSFDSSACVSPVTGAVVSQGGGGGAGGKPYSPPPSLEVSVDLVKVGLKQGETKTVELKVKNEGGSPQSVRLDLGELTKFVLASETSFVLRPYEEKILTLDFTAFQDEPSGVYTGMFILRSEYVEKKIRTIIEVSERKALFDVKVSVPEGFKVVKPGKEVEADIMLYNLGDLKPVDVVLSYGVKDFEDNVFDFRQEALAVEELKKWRKQFKLPEGFRTDFYVFYVILEYKDQKVTSSDIFEVKEKIIEPRISLLLRGLGVYKKEIIISTAILCMVMLSVFMTREFMKYRSFGNLSLFGRVLEKVQNIREGMETRSAEQKLAKINSLVEKSEEHVAGRELFRAKQCYRKAHGIWSKLSDEEKAPTIFLRLNSTSYSIKALEKSLEKSKEPASNLGKLKSEKQLYIIREKLGKK